MQQMTCGVIWFASAFGVALGLYSPLFWQQWRNAFVIGILGGAMVYMLLVVWSTLDPDHCFCCCCKGVNNLHDDRPPRQTWCARDHRWYMSINSGSRVAEDAKGDHNALLTIIIAPTATQLLY
jgi:hypothetical protein